MFRIDGPQSVSVKPTPAAPGTEEFFKDGAVGPGDGTDLHWDWLNLVQESLMAFLDDQGLPQSKTDYGQFSDAVAGVVQDRIAAAQIDLRGYISGLRYTPTGDTTFDISEGVCRDVLNAGSMVSGGTISKNIALPFNATGAGAMASGNVFTAGSSLQIFRIFALGKTTVPGAIAIGTDQHPAAQNLFNDAGGNGWNLYRQIGWACYNLGQSGGGLASTKQDPANPSYWRAIEGEVDSSGPHFIVDQEAALDAPGETLALLLMGVRTLADSGDPGDGYLNAERAPHLADVDQHQLAFRTDSNDVNHEEAMIFIEALGGSAQASATHFANAPGGISSENPVTWWSNQGFFWDRGLP